MVDIVVSADLPRGLPMPAQNSTNQRVRIACIYPRGKTRRKKPRKALTAIDKAYCHESNETTADNSELLFLDCDIWAVKGGHC